MGESLAGEWLGHDGIEMHDEVQLGRLRRWQAYGALFDAIRLDSSINRHAPGSGYVENGWYHTPDAEIYAAMIADGEPELIVEVGGGFSTLIARRTIDELGLASTRLVVVDPSPRIDVGAAADEVVSARVQDVPLDALLQDSMLLFVDSSHVTAAGGDVPHLYNRLVPSLPGGTLVHAHDIFIPFDYREDYRERGYTEQYTVHALLAGSDTFSVEFAAVYMSWRHPDAMRATFGQTVPGRHAGAALWFRCS